MSAVPSMRVSMLPPTDRLVLFLDLDGTLAPIEAAPDQVGPSAVRTRLLLALSRALGGRVAVLSGRSLDEIDRILGGSVTAAAGLHGLERRSVAGVRTAAPVHEGLPRARRALADFARDHPGVLVEDKGASLALHYRQAPELAETVADFAAALGAGAGLVVQAGRMVRELLPPGGDKGDALRLLMREPLFRDATPVMLGDDLTDEHAFTEAAALGGFGVLVGPPRCTGAAARLDDVASVMAMLRAIAALGEGRT